MTMAKKKDLNFSVLVNTIKDVDRNFSLQANKAVNVSLTLRNWFIGYYIQEYELYGADRAEYGKKLIEELAKKLKDISRTQKRELNRYRLFFKKYPQIGETASPQLLNDKIIMEYQLVKKGEAVSPQLVDPEKLISSLSFSHFDFLISIDGDIKRTFYEIECIKGNWSVRELKRQINSLYYERSGLSKNKEKLSELANQKSEKNVPALDIRDPYIFEFLGLKAKEVMGESHLEDELLNRLQDFLIELGHGFCFEAKQKRILIGEKHFFIDLVFYHRILKCHILVELKLKAFNHENIGQLNTYVSYYKKNMMSEGDNPPVGILLCTDKDSALVEYALAGMDDNLFVSKYQLELPDKDKMREFIEEQMKESNSRGVGL